MSEKIQLPEKETAVADVKKVIQLPKELFDAKIRMRAEAFENLLSENKVKALSISELLNNFQKAYVEHCGQTGTREFHFGAALDYSWWADNNHYGIMLNELNEISGISVITDSQFIQRFNSGNHSAYCNDAEGASVSYVEEKYSNTTRTGIIHADAKFKGNTEIKSCTVKTDSVLV